MIKQKAGEDFSAEKVEAVISMLGKGETKKSCCNFLGMNYSTTRLAKIIEEYNDKQNFLIEQRKKLRGTQISKQDITYIVQAYINNAAISNIADDIFRSISTVKNVLAGYGVPLRKIGISYFNPVFIEDDTPDDYKPGDLVFSAKYNTIAEIVKKIKNGVYRIYLQGSNERYAHQYYYELADLRLIQKELDIIPKWMNKEDIIQLRVEAIKTAQRKEKERK